MKAIAGTLAGLFIIIILCVASGESNEPCTSPLGEQGKCIILEECNHIYELFKDPITRRANYSFLRASQCGRRDRNVLVCCTGIGFGVRAEVQAPVQPIQLPSPARRECGRVVDDRIVGGTGTKFDEFPWTALLEYEKFGKSVGHKCGGSLINNRYVLTAAHCARVNKPTKVRLGEWDVNTNPDCVLDSRNKKHCALPHVDLGVEKIIPHPQYNERTQHNDIALIRLESDVEFTFFIQPICMPPESTRDRDDTSGHIMTVTGWGKTENDTNSPQKLKLDVGIVSRQDCQNIYRRKARIISSQMCAGGVKGQDSCSGDSGGPLMATDSINNKAYTYIAGVVSFGPTPCALEGWPGVYTKVSDFRQWIMENMTP